MNSGEVFLYKNENGKPSVEINLVKNTLWLSQKQMSELFDKNSDTIGLHLKNIYSSKELDKIATTEKSSVVQKEGNRKVNRTVTFYNLDAIISVGYRVNSKKGTQFRIWATNILKEHLTKGYSINEKRLEQLQKTIQLIHRTSKLTSETKDLLDILSDYSSALDILDKFDHQSLTKNKVNNSVSYQIEYDEAKYAIDKLKLKFGGSNLFGNEKDQSFKSSIAIIDQTFDGKELYTSIEEKAAHLLYFVVKNHSFTDGNKRIAAWLFVWYLDKNNFLYKNDGSKRIENNTLVALTLMMAESNPNEKEMMINVIINLIN
ncbi:RhuM family protein [Polaribacter cellanae]|uniref:Virulence protein RhuM/Fic/DOC family protein n=1 Tax=Polaribacter cellanae TaxID=2818493 RepID=A0A975H6K2_9FLAO|nr:RhuM family protein [Polaribacter cellanae]QTE22004.1 virulence protein RhuM/Fic/DOC family protein [Polaribacter cellanae]